MMWSSVIVIQGFVLGQSMLPPNGGLNIGQALTALFLLLRTSPYVRTAKAAPEGKIVSQGQENHSCQVHRGSRVGDELTGPDVHWSLLKHQRTAANAGYS
jgi:hypothetical protein